MNKKSIKNKVKKRVSMVVLTLSLVLPYFTYAQESDFGNWLLYIGNKQLNEKWNIHNEVQYRSYNVIDDLEQLLIRTGVGYNLSENNDNILLGYGYILSENYIGDTDDKVSINEHRIFQQFTTKQSVGIVNLSHRYRFEQRFIEADFKMRFRYFLGFNVPLTKNENNRYYLSAYNEIFLNTQSSVFDRNRLYGGLGYKFNSSLRLEIGYMNQFFETNSRDQLSIITYLNF